MHSDSEPEQAATVRWFTWSFFLEAPQRTQPARSSDRWLNERECRGVEASWSRFGFTTGLFWSTRSAAGDLWESPSRGGWRSEAPVIDGTTSSRMHRHRSGLASARVSTRCSHHGNGPGSAAEFNSRQPAVPSRVACARLPSPGPAHCSARRSRTAGGGNRAVVHIRSRIRSSHPQAPPPHRLSLHALAPVKLSCDGAPS